MKSFFVMLFALPLLASVSFAQVNPFAGKHYTNLDVSDARYGFEKITSSVNIQTEHFSDVSFLTLTYILNEEPQLVELEIYQAQTDACGVLDIYADYAKPANGHQEARYFVHLTDYSKSICEMPTPWTVRAQVRKGYGFCGTMDATMTLTGSVQF